jgi:broad specificity phosphatase PhoE
VEFFEGVPFDEIHSSDMQRATATIEPLAVRRRLPVQTTPHLREPVTDRRPTAFLPPEELAALLKDPSRLTAQPLPKLETHTRTS